MQTLLRAWWGFLVLVAPVGWVWGQDSQDIDAQRRAIDAQRAQLLREWEAQEVSCATRFIVNDCLAQVAAQRRKALAAFKRRELELDDAQRLQRSATQQQHMADKLRERQERESRVTEPANTPAARLQRQAEKQATYAQQAQSQARAASQPKSPSGPDPIARQRSREVYDEKQKALEQRRLERDQRLREHPSSSASLPTPP